MMALASPLAADDGSLTTRFTDTYLPDIFEGFVVTVELSLLGIALTAVIAVVSGLMRVARNPLIRGISRVYVEIFRGTSLLVQVFWLYFALGDMGLKLDRMFAGVLALGLGYGAYASEIVRGSIQSVPKAQYEATVALNMTPFQRMRRVIFPQAVPLMIPSFGNTVVEICKGTALVSLIGLNEMAFKADQLRQNDPQDSFLLYFTIMIIYFLWAQLLIAGMRWLERRANASVGKGPQRTAKTAAPIAGGGGLA